MSEHLRTTPKDFFRGLLRQACDEQKVLPSESAEFYLVQLLERFVRHEQGLLDRPLALDYLESLEGDPPERYQRLKHVGDTALFVSGVFTESLEGKAVGADYYTPIGGPAYAHPLACTAPRSGGGDRALHRDVNLFRFRPRARR
jgi:hypothetical protein